MRRTCDLHFSGDVNTPCAWPDCTNGTTEDRYEQAAGAGVSRLQRVQLAAYSGEPRYFWRAVGAGWWSIANAVQLRELGLIQQPIAPLPQRIYHYTSAPAFKLIVESQELWLSDYRFLNDSSEVSHGLSLADQVFAERSSEMTSAARRLFSLMLSRDAENQPRVCVACFSFERDSLTQWKAYGDRALGICLGVDPLMFVSAAGAVKASRFSPVIYRDDFKHHLLRSFLHDWSQLVALDADDDVATPDLYEKAIRLYLFELLAMMKDAAFADEREVRLIYIDHAKSFAELPLEVAATRYRSAGPLIVPFTTTKDVSVLPHAQPKLGSRIAITDVVVGPHPLKELATFGIKEFLAASGYSDVPVDASVVPFR